MSDFSKTSYSTDISYLLPSDDQLDYLVDKLCDNMPTLRIASEPHDPTKDFSVASSTGSDTCDNSDESKNDDFDEETPAKSSPMKSKYSDKRSLFNNDLNIAIMQCSGSLELLSERRKNLEMLVQQQHNVANINYNFSYAPRLPDSPTRVDRLMYDISRERCRILGLTSALDKTIQSFSSKTTKDDLRKLLVLFGSSILDVMKERQSEVIFTQSNGTKGDYDTSKGVLKLVELLGEVHRMNRAVHTALWCIEIKEQVGLVLQRTKAGKGTVQRADTRSSNQIGITVQNSWQSLKATTIPSKRYTLPVTRTSIGARVKSTLQTPQWVSQQPNGIYQILPQQNQTQKGIQIYTQEQKTEIYQRIYSPLKQSS